MGGWAEALKRLDKELASQDLIEFAVWPQSWRCAIAGMGQLAASIKHGFNKVGESLT